MPAVSNVLICDLIAIPMYNLLSSSAQSVLGVVSVVL